MSTTNTQSLVAEVEAAGISITVKDAQELDKFQAYLQRLVEAKREVTNAMAVAELTPHQNAQLMARIYTEIYGEKIEPL